MALTRENLIDLLLVLDHAAKVGGILPQTDDSSHWSAKIEELRRLVSQEVARINLAETRERRMHRELDGLLEARRATQ